MADLCLPFEIVASSPQCTLASPFKASLLPGPSVLGLCPLSACSPHRGPHPLTRADHLQFASPPLVIALAGRLISPAACSTPSLDYLRHLEVKQSKTNFGCPLQIHSASSLHAFCVSGSSAPTCRQVRGELSLVLLSFATDSNSCWLHLLNRPENPLSITPSTATALHEPVPTLLHLSLQPTF